VVPPIVRQLEAILPNTTPLCVAVSPKVSSHGGPSAQADRDARNAKISAAAADKAGLNHKAEILIDIP
jgi:hypothetical protein